MATYKQIQAWVKERHNLVPKSCWIASIKAREGKTSRIAFNRLDPNNRKHPCPQKKEEAIKEALRHFSII